MGTTRGSVKILDFGLAKVTQRRKAATQTTLATEARGGMTFLYAVPSRGQITIYQQTWSDGKIVGTPQVALKVPFTFPLSYLHGNAYDFSRDLSTIVYARPGGHADLYLLSQK